MSDERLLEHKQEREHQTMQSPTNTEPHSDEKQDATACASNGSKCYSDTIHAAVRAD